MFLRICALAFVASFLLNHPVQAQQQIRASMRGEALPTGGTSAAPGAAPATPGPVEITDGQVAEKPFLD